MGQAKPSQIRISLQSTLVFLSRYCSSRNHSVGWLSFANSTKLVSIIDDECWKWRFRGGGYSKATAMETGFENTHFHHWNHRRNYHGGVAFCETQPCKHLWWNHHLPANIRQALPCTLVSVSTLLDTESNTTRGGFVCAARFQTER